MLELKWRQGVAAVCAVAVTPLPEPPPFVEGVIGVRGRVVLVLASGGDRDVDEKERRECVDRRRLAVGVAGRARPVLELPL